MSDRWFLAGAFADGPFTAQADILFQRGSLDKKLLFETDIFFATPDDPDRGSLPRHMLILDGASDDAQLERMLIRFGGADFLSRLGHDVVNLFSPLLEDRFLSSAAQTSRVEQGVRFGKQLNLIGHLLQEDLAAGEAVPAEELLFHLTTAARRKNISVTVDREGDASFPTVPARFAGPLAEETVMNWSFHSCGEERITLSSGTRTIILSNATSYAFPYRRLKAVLRRPFQKFGLPEGNGMGLCIIALIADTGGFSWDIAAQDGRFSLSFSFGVSPSPGRTGER